MNELGDEKLPLNDGDGDVGEEDEPGDRVQAPVEDQRHGGGEGARKTSASRDSGEEGHVSAPGEVFRSVSGRGKAVAVSAWLV